jgi:hypothetical protein
MYHVNVLMAHGKFVPYLYPPDMTFERAWKTFTKFVKKNPTFIVSLTKTEITVGESPKTITVNLYNPNGIVVNS